MTIYYKATFQWEKREKNGTWSKHFWSMASHPSMDSFFTMESTFDSIDELKKKTQVYIDNLKKSYGENARFVGIEVTQYVTSRKIFNSIEEIKEQEVKKT